MSIFSWLTGGVVSTVASATETIGGVFRPNAEAQDQRAHEADMAALGQLSTEFRAHIGQTKWDSFVDGLNRLPRPLMALSVFGMFILAPMDPARFIMVAEAYSVMPDGYWLLLGTIIAFYFGGKIALDRGKMAFQGNAIEAAKQLVEKRKEFRKIIDDEDDGLPDVIEMKNSVIKKWKELSGG